MKQPLAKKKQEISIISEIDTLELFYKELFGEIRTALNIADETYLSEILSDHSKIPHDELLLKIKQFNVEFDYFEAEADAASEGDDEYDDFSSQKWIKIGSDLRIKLNMVNSIKRYNLYNEVETKLQYLIIINEDPSGKMFHCNERVIYDTAHERDLEYFRIEKILVHFFDALLK